MKLLRAATGRLGRGSARNRGRRQPFRHSVSGWSESTLAGQAWQRSKSAITKWALLGAAIGAVVGLVAFAPAAWLARMLATSSNAMFVLADARGTLWSGSALPVLTGGAQSRDASALPSRLNWGLMPRLSPFGFTLELQQDCCLPTGVTVALQPRLSGFAAQVLSSGNTDLGRWPTIWLSGLGTPWNTLQMGGSMHLKTQGLQLEVVEGRWRMRGSAQLDLTNASSRLSTLPTLGNYQLTLAGDAASAGTPTLSLRTVEGALQLSGEGRWGPGGVRFRGEASAQAADEVALSNLLNIIGRRDGARSVLSIG